MTTPILSRETGPIRDIPCGKLTGAIMVLVTSITALFRVIGKEQRARYVRKRLIFFIRRD